MANARPMLGQSFGRYQLVHPLGQGGMGEVYLAKLTGSAGFEKLCVVKTVLPAIAADKTFLDRFHHEARVLVQLSHANIAQIYDMGEVEGRCFMALEYVAGVDMARVLERARDVGWPMPVPVALYIGQRVAEALGYAHRKTGADGAPLGLVHRDVSPQNVMISYEGEVKVIDFGLAKSTARSKHTQPATLLGKLGYMSPEQARTEGVDHKSDVYTCGVVVWEMLAGRPLFPGATVGEMVAAMANPRIPPLPPIRSEVRPAIDAVVAKALAVDPAARYAGADDFARALNAEFVRMSAPVGAEEIGSYVRDLCPEDYAAQRQLISGLLSSGMRTQAGRASVEPTTIRAPASGTAPGEPLDATMLRTSDIQAIRRPKAAWRIAAVVGLAAVAGVLVFRGGSSDAPGAQRPADPASPQGPIEFGPGRAPPVAVAAPAPTTPASGIAAEPGQAVERQREEAAKAKGDRAAASTGAAAKTARSGRSKAGREIAAEPARPAEAREPVATAPPPPPHGPTEVPQPPPAAPVPPPPPPAIAVPEPPPPPPVPIVAPKAPPPPAPLAGTASWRYDFFNGEQVILGNEGVGDWTRCEVRLPDHRRAALARLAPRAKQTLRLATFERDGESVRAKLNWVHVRCAEGEARFEVRR